VTHRLSARIDIMRRPVCFILVAMAIVGCGRPKPPTEEFSRGPAIEMPTPQALPTANATPAPVGNLAPEGILYITKRVML
jgi:hypothetical protein